MFDYAALLAGIKTVWQVEINEFCQKLLAVRFPDAKKYRDIKKIDGKKLQSVNIISGGFPCQPHSIAGKRKGREDDRNLYPDMLRVIRENKPEWVLGENVYGILNTDDGEFFEQEIIAPLEDEGYSVQPYIIPASAIKDTVHRRDRLWILAHSRYWNDERKKNEGKSENEAEEKQTVESERSIRRNKLRITINPAGKGLEKSEKKRIINPLSDAERGNIQFNPDTNGNRFQEQRTEQQTDRDRQLNETSSDTYLIGLEGNREKRNNEGQAGLQNRKKDFGQNWIEVATQLCRVDATSSSRLLESRYRKHRLEGLGNGIQWEIAYIFFLLIKDYENEKIKK